MKTTESHRKRRPGATGATSSGGKSTGRNDRSAAGLQEAVPSNPPPSPSRVEDSLILRLAGLLEQDGISVAKLLLAALFFEDRIRRPSLAHFISLPGGQTYCSDGLMFGGLPDRTEELRTAKAEWEERCREDYLSRRASSVATIASIDEGEIPELISKDFQVLDSPSFREAFYRLVSTDSETARKTLTRFGKALIVQSKRGFSEEKALARGRFSSAAMAVQVLRQAGLPEKVAAPAVAEKWGLSEGQLRMWMSRNRASFGRRRLPYRERKGPAAGGRPGT